MVRKKTEWVCDEAERRRLEQLAGNPLEDPRAAERAGILLACLEKRPMEEIAEEFHVSRSMIFRWRARYLQSGVPGLRDKPRPGKPPVYGEAFERLVLETLRQQPPPGKARWDGAALARRVNASQDAVWRLLRRQEIVLTRRRIWQVPAGAEVWRKYPHLAGLYIAPPLWILALEEPACMEGQPRVVTRDKRLAGVLEDAHKKGALSVADALRILAAIPRDSSVENRKQADILGFLEDMRTGGTPGRKLNMLVSGSAGDLGVAGWRAAHSEVEFYFDFALEGALQALAESEGIKDSAEEYMPLLRAMLAYPATAAPFVWKKFGCRRKED